MGRGAMSVEEALPIEVSAHNEALPEISPDGRWVTYQGDDSGRWEVYVERFPDGGERTQVSRDGGVTPRWNPRGGELFFVAGNRLMAVEVSSDDEAVVGVPAELFSGEALGPRTRCSAPWRSRARVWGPPTRLRPRSSVRSRGDARSGRRENPGRPLHAPGGR